MLSLFRSVAWPTILATSVLFSVAPPLQGETSAEEALKDMSGTLGPNAGELNILLNAFVAPTWAQAGALLIEDQS